MVNKNEDFIILDRIVPVIHNVSLSFGIRIISN